MVAPSSSLWIERLHLRRSATLGARIEDDGRLVVILGEGSGALAVAGAAAAVWMPLRGRLQVRTFGLDVPVYPRRVLVTGPETRLQAVAHANTRWLALVGGDAAWNRLLAALPTPGTRLLPAVHAIGPDLRRRILALLRGTTPPGLEGRLAMLAGELANLQAPLYQALARSPGRSFATKLQVFLRLQRVRRFMTAYCERELDTEALARVANYSPCHFLRTFKTVYRQTPHAYLVTQRLRHAQRLLRSGDLAVTEVALASGFENRSAFSRRYRQHFGVTACEVKRLGAQCRSGRGAG